MFSILFFIVHNKFVHSQKYSYTHFGTENGLASFDVNHVFQDSKGYIWFATNNGVSKFNGNSFKNYDLSDGLPKNTVLEIYEDYKGRIWFVTLTSKLAYLKNNKIYPYKFNKKLSNIFSKKNVSLKSSFHIDSLDNIYIGKQYSGIYKISKKGEISFVLNHKESYNGDFNTINDFYIKLKNNNYFYSNKNNLFFADSLSKTKIKLKTKIKWLSKDKHDNVWVCSENNGAICYKNGNLSDKTKKTYLKDFNVSSVLQDNNGNYWFTTTNNGVFYLISENIYSYTIKNGLLNNNIKCIEVENNNVWLAYDFNTISKFSNNEFKHIKLSEKENIKINKLTYDKQRKQLLIGSSDNLFVLSDNKKQKPKEVFLPINNFNRKININDITINNKGNYILACKKGIELYNNTELNKYNNDLSLFSLNTNSILYENDTSMWFGTINGLWKYINGVFKDYGEVNEKFKIRVLDIIKYKNKLIIATKGGGILIYENNKITQLTKKNGLSSNTITSLHFTDDATLWAGSINGLNNIVFLKSNAYKVNNQEFNKFIPNKIREIKDFEDKLIIATNNGLIYFDYKKQVQKTIKIPLYVNSIKINEIDTIVKANYNLSSDKNNIKIKFEAIIYNKTINLKKRYKVLGLDTNWVYINNNTIRLTQLLNGDYKIIIEVFSKNNVIVSKKQVINITIQKPLWRKNIMIIIYFAFVLVIFYIIYLLRLKRMQEKMIIEQDINWHKKQALFSQMNPHFLFNSLNSINNYILINEKREASKYLTKFSILMRRMLEDVQNEYITIANEIETTKLYLEIESLRLKNKFVFDFIIDKNINIYNNKIPGMIIQPFLENSIWHGIQPLEKEGKITIVFKNNKDTILISIKDNGIGRQESMKINSKRKPTHKSFGTSIAYKRIQLLKKIFKKNISIEYTDKFEAGKSLGTSVHITIPYI